ncbi:MAG: DUF202 domain-containing protein [Thermodesulfobacteriaceae bacterium]|nr:DUF202 domain-containing protein [Thermodesulfobacteriaceae bacterium]MCX8041992.1 DUF202 domain-containing protein [Thermodesulfobacteriaceae bacterium]MDW8136458.1 DUF202 domain-containing protein [Thermodesulfobacterium sp.]
MRVDDPRIYLAVERTFLAWIRTAVAFLAFGVAIEKFDFFIKSLKLAYQVEIESGVLHHMGKILILIGLITLFIAKINFWRTLKKIKEEKYETHQKLYLIYGLIIILLAFFLLSYFWFL